MKKIRVNYFQRRPHKGFSFSLESVFNNLRERLVDKIDAHIYIVKHYNEGYLSKLKNIVGAAIHQGKDINHITGEIHFINFLMRKQRVVLTIHDCGMMNRKTGMQKHIIKWLYLSGPVSRSRVVVAVSEATKREIVGYTDCNPDKVRVIPVPISSQYTFSPKLFNRVKPQLLQIGTGYNKNLLRLIEALEGINCSLTIIGKLSDEQSTALRKYNIDYLNEYDLTDAQMLEKYRACDILTFVSTAEGFGMPIIEANAVGRVVITSNISSMPEVANNAACLVNPMNVQDIRNGVLKVISEDNYRSELIEKGKINSSKYNADTIAEQYLKLYHEMMGI
jgi:glycosyltransferase involved in cell wall biosynthesis